MSFLVPIYFFCFLVFRGATDAGWGVFTLLGLVCAAVPSMRARELLSIGGWKRQDSLLALAIGSVFLFKLTSALWAETPKLAISNAVWHVYLITWPLVFMGLVYCKPRLNHALYALAAGLIVVAAYDAVALIQQIPFYHARESFGMNVGILAELVLVSGSWMLVAATTPERIQFRARALFVLAVLAAWLVLYTTGRRTEWVVFFMVTLLIGVWRIRHWLSATRVLILCVMLVFICVGLFELRKERFLLAYTEVSQYFSTPNGEVNKAIFTSVGARLEMYRLGISGFLDHPILGMSAGVRPDLLPQYGGGGMGEGFKHRHFHSEYVQALVEGGLVWAGIFLTSVVYFIRKLVLEPIRHYGQNQISVLAFALVASYMLTGMFTAALVYNQPVATFTVFSAFLWSLIRCQALES